VECVEREIRDADVRRRSDERSPPERLQKGIQTPLYLCPVSFCWCLFFGPFTPPFSAAQYLGVTVETVPCIGWVLNLVGSSQLNY
jgi:hypothetical protein